MSAETPSVSEEFTHWRSEFSVPAKTVYLNHAAVGPMPARTLEAIDLAVREAAVEPDAMWQDRIAACERVRVSAASLLGARAPHEVAFVANTSTGLSMVAEGLEWRSGDNVVSAESEFPSNVYPWFGLADRGVELRRVAETEGRVDLEAIAQAVDARTRVVALSWVQYATGFRIDLESIGRLCREHDALFVVDAIQGLGALPFSVSESGVDVCVSAAHKWLLGGEGCGLMYVSDRVLGRLRPVIRGWLSVKNVFGDVTDPPDYVDGAVRFEAGTSNVAGIYGLGASIDWLLEIGLERIAERVLALARRAEEGLRELGFELAAERLPGTESGIVAVRHPAVDAQALRRALAAREIQVADRRDLLRVSPHFYNSDEEIDRLLAEAAELVGRSST